MCQIPENIQEMAKKIKRISLFLQPSVLVHTQRGLCYFVLRRTACCTAHVLAEWMSASVCVSLVLGTGHRSQGLFQARPMLYEQQQNFLVMLKVSSPSHVALSEK